MLDANERAALVELLENWRFEYDSMKYKEGQYARVLRRCANELARALSIRVEASEPAGDRESLEERIKILEERLDNLCEINSLWDGR